jgi:V8-like Glu-specific endopeptidase
LCTVFESVLAATICDLSLLAQSIVILKFCLQLANIQIINNPSRKFCTTFTVYPNHTQKRKAMSTDNKDPKVAPLAKVDTETQPVALRSAQDRPDDPLFVPHPEELELLGLESRLADANRYSGLLESICGVVDDSQAVEQYNGTLGVTTAFVAAHQSAACQVQWNSDLSAKYTNPGNVAGVRWGSGTMITNDLFLTCGHLFDQTGGGWERPRENGTTNIISPQQIAKNMHLNFNYQVDPSGTLRVEQSFPILELLEYRLNGIDMAVCRIGGNPGATFGRATVSTTDAAPPDMICIIGHPAGQPKRIEAGPTTTIAGNLIHYNDIDTLGGNSGSGILRASDGRLVGVHTNGGCTPSSPAGGGSNYGQRIKAVIAASPLLQALTTPKGKFNDDIPKLKFNDDGGKLKFNDDIPKLKFNDDGGKLKFNDDIPKLKFNDDGGKLKFIDDGVGKLKVVDDKKLKFGDDVKAPGGDIKSARDNPSGFFPGGIRREGPAARPFILSTPHHSTAWQRGVGNGELTAIEALLVEYKQAIVAADNDLQQLHGAYQELLAYYESVGGGQQA